MSKWRRVDEIITYFGKGVTPKYVNNSSIIVLNQKCIRNNKIDFSFAQFIDDSKKYNEEKFLNIGDILINSTGQGTAGRVAMIDFIPEGKRLITDSHVLTLRTNDYYESKCLNYSLYSIENILQTYVDGSTGQGEFDRVRLFNISVNFSIEKITQKKITAILSALDDKIELNNRINTELEQLAKTLYNYWFVQFDFPISKEQAVAMGNPELEGKPYKTSGGKMTWNEVLKREIPEGWEVKKLKNIAQTGSGGTPKSTEKNYYYPGTIPWINSGELNNSFIVKTENFISEEGMQNSNAKFFPANSIFMAMYGATAGKTSIISFEATTNQAICAIIPNNKTMLGYIKLALNDMYQYLINLSTGSARDNLSQEKIKELNVIIPDEKILKGFSEISTLNFERIKINSLQNQQLASLRDWLLPMLMNGQVTIADVESQVKEAVSKLTIPENKKGFAKQVLAGKIVSVFNKDPHFTDIKFQKVQFLAEHVIEVDLNLNYYYQAAGPYDNKFMHTIFTNFRVQKWFDKQNSRFMPLEKQGKIDEYYQGYFSSADEQLNRLFSLLVPKTEAETEIIATLYAVWNNRMIGNKAISEKELMQDFYQWSNRKQQYTENQIKTAILWLKEHHLEPTGFGKLIKSAKGKHQD